MTQIRIKRVYEEPDATDGYRVLVDRLWPRGIKKEQAALITDYGKDVIQLEQRMAELAATDAAGTKKHHERHAAAPER